MKKVILTGLIAIVALASCKTNKNLTNANTVAEDTTPTEQSYNTFQTPTNPNPPATQPAAPSTTYTPPTTSTNTSVRTQSENFSFADDNDASKYGSSSYFVIVGSFSSVDNANRYKGELISKGFSPVVLHSETGYYRVCVNSYTNEQAARTRVSQIRSENPEYADCWLLIRK